MDDDNKNNGKDIVDVDANDDKKIGNKLIKFPDGKYLSSDSLGAKNIIGNNNLRSPYDTLSVSDVTDPRAYLKELRDRERHVYNDDLVQAFKSRSSTHDIINAVLSEIAEELAHLKYERKKASKEGKNTTQYNISRIAGLRQLADELLKRQESSRAEKLDLKSPRFQSIMKLWMEFLYEAMQKSGLGPEDINLVFHTMKADMVEWEKKIVDVT